MKKFILGIIFLCIPFLASANDEMDRLKLMFAEEKYYIDSYDVSKLDQDILTVVSGDDLMSYNSIEVLSKEKTWNKQLFLDFVEALKNENTKKAIAIYSKNWKSISPFLPTCCAFVKYVAYKSVDHGIIVLTAGGQEGLTYSLEYIYYKDGYLYNIAYQSGFQILPDLREYGMNDPFGFHYCTHIDGSYQCRKMPSQKPHVFMRQLLHDPKRNADFNREYNKFLEEIQKI